MIKSARRIDAESDRRRADKHVNAGETCVEDVCRFYVLRQIHLHIE